MSTTFAQLDKQMVKCERRGWTWEASCATVTIVSCDDFPRLHFGYLFSTTNLRKHYIAETVSLTRHQTSVLVCTSSDL